MEEAGKINCTSCGAELHYKPGSSNLVCRHCQSANEIPVSDDQIEELDYNAHLGQAIQSQDQISERFVKCVSCGASETVDPLITSGYCVYCGTALIMENSSEETIVQPKSILPFKLASKEAHSSFKKWMDSLWFAPDQLKKATLNFDRFKGVYVPYWTFDTRTHSAYTGQRGTHYYVTETYTSNGKTQTRQVQRTRWTNVSGSVNVDFDDILVVASTSLSKEHIEKLEPWDLPNLVPYQKSFLSGFITEKYQIDLAAGFEKAKVIADGRIRNAVNADIGGDAQQILSVQSKYDHITFKHILLPVYVSAYRYKNKLYQFLVNARTGEVQGERPWSWVKIALTVIAGIVIIGGIILAMQ